MTGPSIAQRLQEARRLDAEGQVGGALFAYKLLLRLAPDCLEAKVDCAGLLSVLERHGEAEQLCREVVAADPGNLPARLNLAAALWGQGDCAGAVAQYEWVTQAAPDHAAAHLDLGCALVQLDRLEEAQAALERGLALEPRHGVGNKVLVRVLLGLQDWAGAQAAWARVDDEQLAPAERALDKALSFLLFGAFEQGWAFMERHLAALPPDSSARSYPKPRWDGAPFPGKTLLLHWEQGLGDTVMFIRYAALIKARGGRVVAQVQAALLPLVQGMPGLDAVLGPEEPLPPYDLQVSLGSLPGLFGTRLETIPAAVPYLRAPLTASPALEAALADPAPGLRVGLVWAGNPNHARDAQRSIPPGALAGLADVPGVVWYSLQVGQDGPLPFEGIRTLGPLLTDFGATAWAIEHLDLVLTVDTSVAHLAGALGRPAWLLLTFIPDWRWLLGREDSPWYPSLRLFRQGKPNQWAEVVDRLREALRSAAAANRHP